MKWYPGNVSPLVWIFLFENWKQSICRRCVCRNDFVEMRLMKDKLTGDLPKVVGVAKIHEQKHPPPFPVPKKCIFEAFYIKNFIKKNKP